jgi:hypothetical protein
VTTPFLHFTVGRLLLTTVLGIAGLSRAASAQRHYPPISARQFVSGNIEIKVTGAFAMNETVALNTMASTGIGDMTWLQYGESGSAQPEALITFTDTNEIGILVAHGKLQATSGVGGNEKPWCTGKVDVTAKRITGEFTCASVTSYDQGTKKMGKVTVEVRFTAES